MGNREKSLKHIAFIMDGNGRWAKQRGLEPVAGHQAGTDTVIKVMNLAQDAGVEYLTFYAFSTENWKRPLKEVNGLMKILENAIDENMDDFIERGYRIRMLGRKNRIPLKVIRKLNNAVKKSASNRQMNIMIALNYGGRTEITDAAKKIAVKVSKGELKVRNINEAIFAEHLYLPDMPDPDLMIRTSGEYRLSNFLLWQLSYSELYFTDTLWPDFGEEDFNKALDVYYARDRRYGAR
jgi:undecaprenyl diphosphate synthase